MAERRNQKRGTSNVQIKRGSWKHDPPKSQRNRVIWVLLGATVVAGAIMMADDEWAWRDSLRRLAHGEEIPAFRANEWEDAEAVRERLSARLLTAEFTSTVEDRAVRRDLALYTLIAAAGDAAISRGGQEMGALMQEFCLDLEWLEEIVSFCPMAQAEAALPILARIYRQERKRMDMAANRRFAAAIAFEFARAGRSSDQALDAYLFLASSGQKHWLNNRFSELSLWQMRVIAARLTDETWSAPATLSWFQRNASLPSRGYVFLGHSLGAREYSLFGESVESPVFLSLYRDAAEGGAASVYEAAGCSTARDRAYYAATAACANGVPALVVGTGDESVCMVDVAGTWEASGTLPEGASCSWGFYGQNHLNFVQLASQLGAAKEKTLAASRLANMGQFLYDSGNQPLSHTFFREAVKAQPLHYAAWCAFRACGATAEQMAEASAAFAHLPGVAAALGTQAAE